MTTDETRRYTMLMRVRDFGEARREAFAKSTVAQQQFAAVTAAVAQLSEHDVTKMSATRDGRGRLAARTALIEHLVAMSRTARAMDPDAPGAEAKFRLPIQQSDQALITAGRLFARNAEALVGHFETHGMPAAFITALLARVSDLEQAMQRAETERSGHMAARASIQAALTGGIAAAKRLDAIVANQWRGDPAHLAAWQRARRVGYRRSGRSTAVAPASTPTPTDVASGAEGQA